MLLIGESVGHVMEKCGADALPVQEFKICYDVVEVVSEDTFPAGNKNRLACKGSGIFFYVQFRQWKIRLLFFPLRFFQPLFLFFRLLSWQF